MKVGSIENQVMKEFGLRLKSPAQSGRKNGQFTKGDVKNLLISQSLQFD
jgi:hypothetical protein